MFDSRSSVRENPKPVTGALLFVVGLALAVSVLSPSAMAAAVTCDRATGSPYVSLEVNPGRINYITDRSKAGLRRLHSGYRTADANWSPIGLTVAELGFGLAISVRAESMADGRFCAEIAAVEATLGYDDIDVYIASEYPHGSCQYNAILDHERLHVIVFQETLNRFFSRVEAALRHAADTAKPILVRDPDKATKKFQSALERVAKPLFHQINAATDEGNGALDTLENYQREQDNCVSW